VAVFGVLRKEAVFQSVERAGIDAPRYGRKGKRVPFGFRTSGERELIDRKPERK